MAVRTRNIDRRRRSGFTLPEALIASVLVATSATAVSMSMSASYQHDRQLEQESAALNTGQQLLDEISALPIVQTEANGMSLLQSDGYTDIVDPSTSSMIAMKAAMGTTGFTLVQNECTSFDAIAVPSDVPSGGVNTAPTTAAPAATSFSTPTELDDELDDESEEVAEVRIQQPARTVRQVSVKRMSEVMGTADAAGRLALITVTTTDESGRQRSIKRLVTTVDAEVARSATKN
jgi:Tfp pilus assembly protein PilV